MGEVLWAALRSKAFDNKAIKALYDPMTGYISCALLYDMDFLYNLCGLIVGCVLERLKSFGMRIKFSTRRLDELVWARSVKLFRVWLRLNY